MNPFEQLITDLANHLNISLKVDEHLACRIDFGSGLVIQIDLEGYGDQILIGSELGLLSPGFFREEILREALKVNGTTLQLQGILAFSEKKNTLMLFQFLTFKEIDRDHFFPFFDRFVQHARKWRDAIQSNTLAEIMS